FRDLKGSTIGSSTPGSTNDRLLKIVLAKNGVNWKKDLTIVYIGSSGLVLKALQGGSIDGAALTPPASFLAEEFGFYPLASFIHEVGALQGGVSTTEGFLRDRKDVAQRFIRATLKGLRVFKFDRKRTLPTMEKFMDLNQGLAGRVYDATVPAFVSDGFVPQDFQDQVLDFELQIIKTHKKVSRDQVFDFSIVKSLAAK
ncbi:MAG TPA: ABC transporter substrate-binding protein, partial [Terriglobales bacterium]|nr:ABC transporter substrate-binding protein [Terriglobales bacterium]